VLWYPTQAPRYAGAGKTGLDPDFLPRCAREIRMEFINATSLRRKSGQMGHPAGREGELQIPRLPPDFLSGLVVSVNFMRLSSKKAAYVVVGESTVVGNPEFAPTARRGRRDDKGERGDSY